MYPKKTSEGMHCSRKSIVASFLKDYYEFGLEK